MRVTCGKLTGKSRYRLSWLRKLILQVECERIERNLGPDGYYTSVAGTMWRDASFNDLNVDSYRILENEHSPRLR